MSDKEERKPIKIDDVMTMIEGLIREAYEQGRIDERAAAVECALEWEKTARRMLEKTKHADCVVCHEDASRSIAAMIRNRSISGVAALQEKTHARKS